MIGRSLTQPTHLYLCYASAGHRWIEINGLMLDKPLPCLSLVV